MEKNEIEVVKSPIPPIRNMILEILEPVNLKVGDGPGRLDKVNVTLLAVLNVSDLSKADGIQ